MKTHRSYRLLLAGICMFWLAACGGGGGGGNSANGSVNQLPAAVDLTFSLDQDSSQSLDLSTQAGIALGDGPSSLSLTSQPTHGQVTISGTSLTYQPDAGFVGSDSFAYQITDRDGETASANATVAVRDAVAPVVQIQFPAASGSVLSSANNLLIRGSASDAHSNITSIRVGGVAATSNDGFATWQARVNLQPGDNPIAIEAADSAGNSNASVASLTVHYQGVFIDSIQAMAVDAAKDRLLVVDSSDNLLEVDLQSGFRKVVSARDDALPFYYSITPPGMLLDDIRHRALVTGPNRIIAVDLTTGIRTVFSGANPSGGYTPDAVNRFGTVKSMALDAAHGRVLVLDDQSVKTRVVAVDLLSGARSILSDNTANSGPQLSRNATTIVVDTVQGNRALVLQPGELIAVDLSTGARSILSDNTTPNSLNPISSSDQMRMVMDAVNNRVLLLDQNPVDYVQGHVLSIDLSTGARTVLSDQVTPDANNPLPPESLAVGLDAARNRLLAAGYGPHHLLSVDLSTGARTIGYDLRLPDRSNPIASNAFGLALDSANQRLLYGDTGVVSAMDLTTGARSTFTDAASAGSSLAPMRGLVLDTAGNRLFSLAAYSIYQEDLATGVRSLFSSKTYPDAVAPLGLIFSAALDAAHQRLLVIDYDPTTFNHRIMAVDTATGGRSVFYDPAAPTGSGPLMGYLWDIAIDDQHNRAVVTDITSHALFAVDLDTGARQLLSDNTYPNGNNAFSQPKELVLDRSGSRAFVRDYRGILEVDLNTGARRRIPDPSAIQGLSVYGDLVLDEPNQRLLLRSSRYQAIFFVDIDTGERVILSR